MTRKDIKYISNACFLLTLLSMYLAFKSLDGSTNTLIGLIILTVILLVAGIALRAVAFMFPEQTQKPEK